MDPYSSPYIIPNKNPYSPFPPFPRKHQGDKLPTTKEGAFVLAPEQAAGMAPGLPGHPHDQGAVRVEGKP